MKKELLPDFAKPFKTKGYDVRVVNGVYRLIKVTSKRVPGKRYPVLQQEFIGIIDPQKGLIPKKIRPDVAVNLEFGFSSFLFLNFHRELQRVTFSDDLLYVKLAIVNYLYGSVEPRFLSLSFLTFKDEKVINLALVCSLTRIRNLSNKIEKLLVSSIPDEHDRKYIMGSLRQMTVPKNFQKKTPLIYPDELLDLFRKYGLRYE